MESDNDRTSSHDKPENSDTDEEQWEYYDDSTTLSDLWHVSLEKRNYHHYWIVRLFPYSASNYS